MKEEGEVKDEVNTRRPATACGLGEGNVLIQAVLPVIPAQIISGFRVLWHMLAVDDTAFVWQL